ncbi:HepT-like ribonuclease domain-containing protein [Tomitella biformata]|uniref:HepT-like ribonuclease domain-containing protein n=1 Tax=Tomitella biformata TaxID=630403 RepID=UPI000467DCA6|nr:HepT-like ribonuclease domain-containing protein [Tomitella biformata]
MTSQYEGSTRTMAAPARRADPNGGQLTSRIGGGRVGESGPDLAALEHRVITMQKMIAQLVGFGDLGREQLDSNPAAGLVIERMLALLVELAFDVNSHVAGVVSGEAPRTFAESFGAAGRAGLIDVRLAAALAPVDGPHHVQVQLYMDTDPAEVGAVVSAVTAGYQDYLLQVGEWIEARMSR